MATETRVIGPIDPDNSSQLTERLGVHNKAHELLRRHAKNYPAALTAALATPVHPAATTFLRDRQAAGLRDAIEEYARGLKGREAFLDEDDVVEDISVRAPQGGLGAFDDPTYFAVLYRKGGSGRSARAVIPYSEVPEFDRALEAFEAEKEAGGSAGPTLAVSDDETSQLLEEAATERDAAEKEAAELRAQLRDLGERLDSLENPEPFAGYDETSATDLVKRLKDGGASEFGTIGLQAIVSYEEARDNPRKTVLEAAKDAQAEVAER